MACAAAHCMGVFLSERSFAGFNAGLSGRPGLAAMGLWSYGQAGRNLSGGESGRKDEAPGCRPGAGDYLVSISYCYFFSSSIAALALSAASDDFPALHAASASLTSVEAFWKSAERGDWISWPRGDWMS